MLGPMITTATDHTTSTTTSGDVARRFVDDILNHGRFDVLAEIVHPNYRYEGPDGTQLHGLRELEHLIRGFHGGFSDFHAELTSTVESGEHVAMTMVLTGTHDGEFEGLVPTGAQLRLPIAIFTRVEAGRIVDDREFYDTATLLAQLS